MQASARAHPTRTNRFAPRAVITCQGKKHKQPFFRNNTQSALPKRSLTQSVVPSRLRPRVPARRCSAAPLPTEQRTQQAPRRQHGCRRRNGAQAAGGFTCNARCSSPACTVHLMHIRLRKTPMAYIRAVKCGGSTSHVHWTAGLHERPPCVWHGQLLGLGRPA